MVHRQQTVARFRRSGVSTAAMAGVGLALLLTGFELLVFFAATWYDRWSKLEALQPLHEAGRQGVAYVEGIVSPKNATVRGNLVAFIQEERSKRNHSRWYKVGGKTPVIKVETAHGTVTLNDRYRIGTAPVEIPDGLCPDTGEPQRIRGFAAGDAIVAYGDHIPIYSDYLYTTAIYAGNHAAHIAEVKRAEPPFATCGIAALLLGVALTAGGYGAGRRNRREQAPASFGRPLT